MAEERFVKVRVRNMELKRGGKHRDIYTNNADGKRIVIKDGSEVELTEYAYNNLIDAVEIIVKHEDQGVNSHPLKVEVPHSKIDVVKLSDFYTKGEKGIKPVVEKFEPVLEAALAGA